jgi:hypothetical protein
VGEVVAAVAELPVGTTLTLYRIGMSVGRTATQVNLVLRAAGPTSLYSVGDMDPPTITDWAPRSGRRSKGARWAVGPTRERSI